jgi:polyhydroxyalkanoate synthesis regulator phasin
MTEGYVSEPYARPTLAVATTEAIKRMSWGAVLAGAVVALSVQLLLTLLGLGIGLATVDPAAGGTPDAATFGIATGVFYAIVTLLSLFFGGWVAGRLAGMPVRTDGLLHGLVTWSVAMLVLLYVVTTSVGAILSGTLGMVGTALQAAGQGAQAAAGAAAESDIGQQAMNAIQRQAQQLLGQAQQATGAQDTSELLDRVMAIAQGGVSEQEQQQIVDQIVQETGVTREEAQAQLQQLQTQYQEAAAAAEEQARQAAQATAQAVSQGAFWSFVALLCGAIAAAVGGLVGTPRDLSVEAHPRGVHPTAGRPGHAGT